MKLFHPLTNQKAIEKLGEKDVYIFNGRLSMWWRNNPSSQWGSLKERISISFKNALKTTKDYSVDSKIEYHFIDNIGDEKPNIRDFDQEDVYNCTTVKFDYVNRKSNVDIN